MYKIISIIALLFTVNANSMDIESYSYMNTAFQKAFEQSTINYKIKGLQGIWYTGLPDHPKMFKHESKYILAKSDVVKDTLQAMDTTGALRWYTFFPKEALTKYGHINIINVEFQYDDESFTFVITVQAKESFMLNSNKKKRKPFKLKYKISLKENKLIVAFIGTNRTDNTIYYRTKQQTLKGIETERDYQDHFIRKAFYGEYNRVVIQRNYSNEGWDVQRDDFINVTESNLKKVDLVCSSPRYGDLYKFYVNAGGVRFQSNNKVLTFFDGVRTSFNDISPLPKESALLNIPPEMSRACSGYYGGLDCEYKFNNRSFNTRLFNFSKSSGSTIFLKPVYEKKDGERMERLSIKPLGSSFMVIDKKLYIHNSKVDDICETYKHELK